MGYGERAAKYYDAVDQGLGMATEAEALFQGAGWCDPLQPLPQHRDPRDLNAGGGLTIVHDLDEYTHWCIAIDDHLARWDASREDAWGRVPAHADYGCAPDVALPVAA